MFIFTIITSKEALKMLLTACSFTRHFVNFILCIILLMPIFTNSYAPQHMPRAIVRTSSIWRADDEPILKKNPHVGIIHISMRLNFQRRLIHRFSENRRTNFLVCFEHSEVFAPYRYNESSSIVWSWNWILWKNWIFSSR